VTIDKGGSLIAAISVKIQEKDGWKTLFRCSRVEESPNLSLAQKPAADEQLS